MSVLGMSRVFAPKASVGLPAANDIPEFSPPEAEEVCSIRYAAYCMYGLSKSGINPNLGDTFFMQTKMEEN